MSQLRFVELTTTKDDVLAWFRAEIAKDQKVVAAYAAAPTEEANKERPNPDLLRDPTAAVEASCRMHVFKKVVEAVEKAQPKPTVDNKVTMESIAMYAVELVLARAQNVGRSTSELSNLRDRYDLAAWATAARAIMGLELL